MTRREKRLRRAVVYLRPSVYDQLELFKNESSNILSMSDYLHEVLERHVDYVQVSKQRISRRVGNQ